MRWRGRMAWIAVAGATSCALGAGNASAGVTYGDLDLRFTGTTTNFTTVPGRADQSTYDPCFGTERLVGVGGYLIEAVPAVPNRSGFALGKAYNVSIHPFDLMAGAPVPDSTQQVADNLFKVDNDISLGETTTCAEGVQQLAYPSSEKNTPKRERTTAKVECAGGKHVLSGGAFASGPFRSQRLVSSAPFDSNDPGSKPDDGWRVAVDNLKGKRRKVEVHAICAPVSGLSYLSDEFNVKKRSRKHVELDCPAGEYALGGGVTHTAPYRKATLVGSRAAPNPLSFVAWITEVDNLSRKRAAGRAFAICHA